MNEPSVARCFGTDPYLFLFQHVIVEAIHAGDAFVGEPVEPIGFVFDQHPRWSVVAHQMYVKLQNENGWEHRDRLGPLAFADKRRFAPLQAADQLAFESYHYINDNAPVHPEMARILSKPQPFARFFDERGLQLIIDECKGAGKIVK